MSADVSLLDASYYFEEGLKTEEKQSSFPSWNSVESTEFVKYVL